ncbi:FGGY family carbohydrate kinase [Microbacterium sp.]|uniref:FGGY family carbohydrate kinase n=1 Tax=Microbacterium sp. TaxID=51671 RepID=UPI003F7187E0
MTTSSGTTLAVDAGTSLIKAVVFDEFGTERLVIRRKTSLSSPHAGWAEQDMTEVRDSVLECIAEAVGQTDRTIDRIAITAQGDGAWMVAHDGQPARPAVLWNDARAVDIVDGWTRDGLLEQAFRVNGSLGNLGLPHAILAWFLENDPAAIAGIRDVVTCGSWLFESLTGCRGLHPSDASAPWLDVETGSYAPSLFKLFGLEGIRALIPPVLCEDELTAPLLPGVSRITGLPDGIPVTLAPYDVVSTGAGGGSVSPGSAFCILGTTLCTGVVTRSAVTSGAPTGLTLLSPGPLIVRAFPTLAGTEVVRWVGDLLGLTDAAEVTQLAGGSAPGARGVRVLPYLSEAGERMPFLDPDARGAMLGITTRTSRADIARATLEGLAHTIRDCVVASGAEVEELVLSGGGSASALWCQVIADVTGISTVRVEGTQIGAKGAMLHALVAAGAYSGLAEAAAATVTRGALHVPDPALRTFFDDRHDDFLLTRAALAERWATWRPDETDGG